MNTKSFFWTNAALISFASVSLVSAVWLGIMAVWTRQQIESVAIHGKAIQAEVDELERDNRVLENSRKTFTEQSSLELYVREKDPVFWNSLRPPVEAQRINVRIRVAGALAHLPVAASGRAGEERFSTLDVAFRLPGLSSAKEVAVDQ
ncbi:MAG: hypothetical protein LBD14_03625 [Puniceicoccales bacterium]|nr:hypothetical protein [Puniceicoccales bacterium]